MRIYQLIFKKFLDFCLSISILFILFPLIFLISCLILFLDGYPVLYWSDRVGANNNIFKMPKFRTMKLGTPEVATNHLNDPKRYMTRTGSFLRKTSLDELPQLWSILVGNMSFVGPRPALFNQYDLIHIRTEKNIHYFLPGLTGWAQVNGRDELSVIEKSKFDLEYCQNCSLILDFKILWLTLIKVLTRHGISH